MKSIMKFKKGSFDKYAFVELKNIPLKKKFLAKFNDWENGRFQNLTSLLYLTSTENNPNEYLLYYANNELRGLPVIRDDFQLIVFYANSRKKKENIEIELPIINNTDELLAFIDKNNDKNTKWFQLLAITNHELVLYIMKRGRLEKAYPMNNKKKIEYRIIDSSEYYDSYNA